MFPGHIFILFDILYDLQSVGQVTAEAVDPGRHCHGHYDSESGVSSADEGEKHSGRLETDTGAGKGTS